MKKTKICNSCNEELDISKFEWQKNRPNPRNTCKKCRNLKREFTDEQKEKRRLYKKTYWRTGNGKDVYEKCRYGVSKSQLDYRHCLICGGDYRLSIDHCHTTGKFRGLLCGKCNSAIGLFNDNTDIMMNAIRYLEHFNNGGSSVFSMRDFPHYQVELD